MAAACSLVGAPTCSQELRVLAVVVLRCPQCGGAMRIIAEIQPPDTTRAILEWAGLPARAPPLPPPDPDPAAFAFDPFEPA